jgi:hypothetical protein
MKEAHAAIYAGIATVTWFVGSLTVPVVMAHYHISFPDPNLPISLCGAVIIALCGLGFGGYLVWEEEARQHATLQERFKPRLRIEFDPTNPKFVAATRTDNGVDMLFVRVNVRALSPVVRGCRAYLTRVSQLEGDHYVSLFDEHLPMPWSNQDPNNFHVPKELNHDVDALLDVAWFAEPDNLLNRHGPFGVLNFNSIIPNGFIPILNRILQHPSQNLKLDILVTADDSENATLSLNIHRGGEWNNPQVGWMRGNEIHHREPNFWTDLTP